jgi:hypothetical protein
MASVLKMEGRIDIYRKYVSDGRREFRQSVRNTVLNSGLYLTLDLLAGDSTRTVDWFAHGSGAISGAGYRPFVVTDSALLAENGTLSLQSHSRTGSSTTFVGVLGASDGNTPGLINEFMIFSSGTTRIPVAAQSFTNETKDNTFELQFEHTVILYNSGA